MDVGVFGFWGVGVGVGVGEVVVILRGRLMIWQWGRFVRGDRDFWVGRRGKRSGTVKAARRDMAESETG